MENPNRKWMMTGGYPHDLGNLHMEHIDINEMTYMDMDDMEYIWNIWTYPLVI